MSDPVKTVTPPVPKPRTRQKHLQTVQSQESCTTESLNRVPDTNTVKSHTDPQGSQEPGTTGVLPAQEKDASKFGAIPNGSGNEQRLFSGDPMKDVQGLFELLNSVSEKVPSSASGMPALAMRQDKDALHSQDGIDRALAALMGLSGARGQSLPDSADVSQAQTEASSGSPPSPVGHLDYILKNLADWATDPGYDSSTEDASPSTVLQETDHRPDASNSVSQPSGDQVHVRSTRQPSEPQKELSAVQSRPGLHRAPRAATIRVSRKKAAGVQTGDASARESAVSRSSWLDVWQGRRHHVLWATLDGQKMSLWKKRSDKFPDVVFHVSSITVVRAQDGGRFSIYFQKKHIEFMAHSEEVQQGWLNSLHSCRGMEPPPAPQQHGPLTMKDPRTKVYAAVSGHNLWIYRNKEDFGLGVGMNCVSVNVASAKQTGRHSFSFITPYKTFSFSADSSKDLEAWVSTLTEVIRSALSCSEVAQRLWASPWNKVCAECSADSPEWASVNLLVVICETCAGQHRSLGINVSKVRSLKMDSKVWTDPLIQLFVLYGNKVANSVWGYYVPASEQILPGASPNQRGAFIRAKYCKGRYRRLHPLASSQRLLNQRLCEVVRGPDVEETISLLCSGARVLCHTEDPQLPPPIALAENAGQAMQVELLRHNEYTETPLFQQTQPARRPLTSSASLSDVTSCAAGQEELHGKLDEDLFLFSRENDSAACDALDLREVISVFDCSSGRTNEFEVLTMTDKLLCSADTREELLLHLMHILKVVLPGPVLDEDMQGVQAASRVLLREGGAPQLTEAWVALKHSELLALPTDGGHRERLLLTPDVHHKLDASENTIELIGAKRTLCLQFQLDQPCRCWDVLLKVAPHSTVEAQHRPLYQLPRCATGTVPPLVERCISHITQYGLTIEGIYRRNGLVTKVNQLVEVLMTSPSKAQLEHSEMGVLDVAGALKQFIRQKVVLIPQTHLAQWVKAAAHTEEAQRLEAYHKLLDQLPPDNRITLSALCGHLYIVQLYSHKNLMTAHNLAVVFVPSLFHELAMNADMVRVTQELIISYTLVFQGENNKK